MDAEEDLKRFGATPAQIAAMLGEREPAHFEIEPENWPAILAFVACETQWRIHQNGRRIGLDYSALDAVMRMNRVKDRAAVFAQVRIMEREALNVFGKR